MPFDACPMREPTGEPWWQLCRSCEQPIAIGETSERLQFNHDDVHKLHRLNGTYHADCARPIMSLIRAYDAAGRLIG